MSVLHTWSNVHSSTTLDTREGSKKKSNTIEHNQTSDYLAESHKVCTMEYLVRLVQLHETFRKPELESLALLHGIEMEILEYSDQV